jgi:hypothetical protein
MKVFVALCFTAAAMAAPQRGGHGGGRGGGRGGFPGGWGRKCRCFLL